MSTLPDYEVAEKDLRFSLEKISPALHEVVFEQVTDALARVLVHAAGDTLTPISREQLKEWHCTLPKALRVAGENMSKLLADAEIDLSEGVAKVEGSGAASLILAPNFGLKLSKQLGGWPILAMVPTADAVWVVPERDKDAAQRAGSAAVRAHKSGKRKLVLEVVRISDKGYRTAGTIG